MIFFVRMLLNVNAKQLDEHLEHMFEPTEWASLEDLEVIRDYDDGCVVEGVFYGDDAYDIVCAVEREVEVEKVLSVYVETQDGDRKELIV